MDECKPLFSGGELGEDHDFASDFSEWEPTPWDLRDGVGGGSGSKPSSSGTLARAQPSAPSQAPTDPPTPAPDTPDADPQAAVRPLKKVGLLPSLLLPLLVLLLLLLLPRLLLLLLATSSPPPFLLLSSSQPPYYSSSSSPNPFPLLRTPSGEWQLSSRNVPTGLADVLEELLSNLWRSALRGGVACVGGCYRQGRTLVHFSAQRKHILWDTLGA